MRSTAKTYAASGLAALCLGLAACGGGGGGSTPTPLPTGGPAPTPTPTPTPPPPPPSPPTPTPTPPGEKTTISGTATFDSVPFPTGGTGLDYTGTTQRPIRGAIVEATTATGDVLASTVTDELGAYAVDVDQNTDVRIQVRARLLKSADAATSGPAWDVEVRDNTSDDGLYVLSGAVANSGTSPSSRDLNAASGWSLTQDEYVGARAAGPFALLDTAYNAIKRFNAIDDDVVFPPVDIFWSPNNRPAGGDIDNGDIGTSFFRATTRTNGSTRTVTREIFILGQADGDSDEYDTHVVTHEFGHYFESGLSRSDSIGGPHSARERLDARLAFGEGFGNALAGMLLDDSVYRDSLGDDQALSFELDVEGNRYENEGWFNEGSVQSILYDIFDATADGSDTVNGGLSAIYDTLTSADYRRVEEPTTIFSFLDALFRETTITRADLAPILAAQSISGTGPRGIGETNAGGIDETLPVFKTLSVGGSVEVCSSDDAGTPNKHGNRDFVMLNVPNAGSVTLVMSRASGPASTDPDFLVFLNGDLVGSGLSPTDNRETLTQVLETGTYFVETSAFANVDGSSTNDTDACFNLTAN